MENKENKSGSWEFSTKWVLNSLYISTIAIFILGLLVMGVGFTMNASTNGEFGIMYILYGLLIEPVAAFFMGIWFICKCLSHGTSDPNE